MKKINRLTYTASEATVAIATLNCNNFRKKNF